MPMSGYTGLSYPFRVNKQGGTVMTTTGRNNAAHISESIRQILGTRPLERVMESEIYSTVDTAIYEPNDEDLQMVIKMQIVEDLRRLEERIEVDEGGIELKVEVSDDGEEILYADITYTVVDYETSYTTKVKLGEI